MVHLGYLLVFWCDPVQRLHVKAVPTFWWHVVAGEAGLRFCFGTTYLFSSCHISVAGKSLLETNEIGQVDPRRVAVHAEFWRATCGASASAGRKAGLESLGPDRGVLPSLGVAGTTWLLSESSIWLRVREDDVGQLSPKKTVVSSFWMGLWIWQRFGWSHQAWVVWYQHKSTLAPHAEDLVYSLPQTLLWGKNRERGAWGPDQACLCWGWAFQLSVDQLWACCKPDCFADFLWLFPDFPYL